MFKSNSYEFKEPLESFVEYCNIVKKKVYNLMEKKEYITNIVTELNNIPLALKREVLIEKS